MRFIKFSLFILGLFSTKGLIAQESNTFEKRMYDIYKSSYNKEVSDKDWAQFVSTLSQKSYTISEGDTLWDLSTIFFGDGFYWPKIWSYNSTLTNPHLLTVGQKIQFFTGSLDLPPGVNVEPNGEKFGEGPLNGFAIVDGASGDGENLDPQDSVIRKNLYPGAPKIPGRRRKIHPVLMNIPSTFVKSDAYDASQYNENGVSMDIRPPVRVNPLFVAHSFLYGSPSKDYPRIGNLVESEDNVLLVGLNQQVYLRATEDLRVGEQFTVMGEDYEFDRNGFDGSVIRYMGIVEISDRLENDLYRATVVNSLSGIKGKPWITREQVPTFADDYVGRESNVEVRIIGGGLDNDSRVFGQSDVVYLGGGTNRGLRTGDILGIYKRRDIRYKDSNIKKSPTPIAHIKIFRAEPKLASAFVLNSTDIIIPGDETGKPATVYNQAELETLDSLETGLNSLPSNSRADEEDAMDFE